MIDIKLNEKLNYSGVFLFKNIRNSKIIQNKILHNMIMDAALVEIIKPLMGTTPDIEIAYLALGTGTSDLDSSQVKLSNEIYRIGVSGIEVTDVGQTTSEFIIDKTTTFASSITEIAIFGGASATSTTDSGLMICRLLLSSPLTKLSGDEWYFQRQDTIANV